MRASLLLAIITLSTAASAAPYGGGTGEPNDPYLIYTPEQMNAIGAEPNDWSKCFKLMADIDLGQYTGTQFHIIGYQHDWPDIKPFMGVFDGNGHTISNFSRDANDTDRVGLFGYAGDLQQLSESVAPNTRIKDLTLLNPHVRARGHNDVGALVGVLSLGRVTNCRVEGGEVQGCECVGVLVGWNDHGTVSACCTTGAASGSGYHTGGLVGLNRGTVRDCYSAASAVGQWYVGSLIGDNMGTGTIVNCYATGSVTGVGCVGGLAGGGDGSVIGSYWNTETSRCTESAGGWGRSTAEMRRSSTFAGWTPGAGAGVWTIDEGQDYPRLYWEKKPGSTLITTQLRDHLRGAGTKDDPFLIGMAEELNMIGRFPYDWDKHFRMIADVNLGGYTGTAFNIIGAPGMPFSGTFDGDYHAISGFYYSYTNKSHVGIFGYIWGPDAEIRNVNLLSPRIWLSSGESLGGLVGSVHQGLVADCSVTGLNVYARGSSDVGGVAGCNSGTLIHCRATGTLDVQTAAGGLVGHNSGGTLRDCSSACTVAAWMQSGGGLVGHNDNGGSILRCCATGSVKSDYWAGGLIAFNGDGKVMDCYSTCTVVGIESVGGLLGFNLWNSLTTNCYAAGKVTGETNVGGLIGADDLSNIVTACFWDTQTSGQVTSVKGIGKTTVEMEQDATFLEMGWDFVGEANNGTADIWRIDEGKDYPHLSWEARAGL
jgi:hypothetical protein